MREVLNAAGFQQRGPINEAALVMDHIHLSGGFNEPFRSTLLDHMGSNPDTKAAFNAAVDAATSARGFDAESFFAATDTLPKADMLAFVTGATQRFFQPQVVVRYQEETDYSKAYEGQILALSDALQMRQVKSIPLTTPIDYAVCIGATSKGANDYLKRHKQLEEARPDRAVPYRLFMLAGGRKLSAADELAAPTDEFNYGGAGRSYLEYLAEYSGKPKETLTEGDMMQERYHTVFGKTVETAIADGTLAVSTAPNAEAFMGEVAAQIRADPDKTPKNLAFTTYDIFARTYGTIMRTALEEQGVDNVTTLCDAPHSIHHDKAQTLIRELAKTINAQYQAVARRRGFEPHAQAKVSGGEIKKLEDALKSRVSVVSSDGTVIAAAAGVEKRGASGGAHL